MAGDELLARIEKNPDDDDAYLVYADYLTGKGDPHGELIVLMQQLGAAKTDEERAYLGNALDAYQTKHRAKLFGELGKHAGIGWGFHLGFLRSVHVCPDINDKVPRVIEQILKLPSARFLRELVLFEKWEQQQEAIRHVVGIHKPKTLDGIAFAKCYESLESALDDAENVQWLDIDVTGERTPAALATLTNLEWLELGGDYQTLPADIAKLTKLRRLDIDWCGNLRKIHEDVWGIESLSYVSMYDCSALPKTYHMGRLNSLLFGFCRSRTSSRRRVIEANMLLGDEARAGNLASKDDLLAALDNNVGAVRDAALRLLGDKLADPFAKGVPAKPSFALLGKTNMDKKQIAARIAKSGGTLTQKIDDATTHVILGVEPGGKQAAIGGRPILLDAHLHALGNAAKPAKQDRSAIIAGLRSADEKQTAKAVAALADGIDEDVLVDLVVVVQDTKLGKSRDGAKKLLALYAPEVDSALKLHLKSSVLLESMGETKRSGRIAAFADAAQIDGLEFAMRLVERARVGLAYVMAFGTSADITNALEVLVDGKKLDLAHKELDDVPDEIAKLAKIEELNVRGNHFTKFPDTILAMKSLTKLDVSHNRIGKIPDAIGKTKLVELDISGCRWRKFPKAVLGIATLEHLEMSNSQEYVENEARIKGMPAEIAQLTKLKTLGYRFNMIEKFPDALWKLPLEVLDIGWCDLPAEIPPQLATMKKLKKLRVLYSTWASKKAALKKLLPKCEIEA